VKLFLRKNTTIKNKCYKIKKMSCQDYSISSKANMFIALLWLGILMSDFWAVSNEVADGKDKFGASMLTVLAAVNATLWVVIGMDYCLLKQHPWFKWVFIATNVGYLVISMLFANLWLRDESNFYKTKFGDMTTYGKFHAIIPVFIVIGLVALLIEYGLTLHATKAEALQSQLKTQQQQLESPDYLKWKQQQAQVPLGSAAVKAKKRITFRR